MTPLAWSNNEPFLAVIFWGWLILTGLHKKRNLLKKCTLTMTTTAYTFLMLDKVLVILENICLALSIMSLPSLLVILLPNTDLHRFLGKIQDGWLMRGVRGCNFFLVRAKDPLNIFLQRNLFLQLVSIFA